MEVVEVPPALLSVLLWLLLLLLLQNAPGLGPREGVEGRRKEAGVEGKAWEDLVMLGEQEEHLQQQEEALQQEGEQLD